MQKQHKDQLRSLVTDLRHTLDRAWNEDGELVRGRLDRELERLGFAPDGHIRPLDALPNRTAQDERAYRVAAVQLDPLPLDERPALRDEIVERAAYTWINRLLALRTMEARRLIDETLRNNPAYEGVSEALYILRYEDPQRTAGPDGGWWAVVENACRAQAQWLPGLFDLQDPNAALRPPTPALLHCVRAIGDPALDEVFADPDAISWAYQFYQEEAKARVYAKLGSGGKVETRSEIAAATQLFTEPYMVKWLLQNSLGRSYAEAYPDTALPETWEYYIDREKILAELDDNGEEADVGADAIPHAPSAAPDEHPLFTLDELTFMDPCCGSGHFLREAFDMLYVMYRERHAGMAPRAAAIAIVRHHLHGIDIDPRAVQLSAITLVMRAWETVGVGPFELPSLNLATTPAHLDAGALERHLQRHPEDEVYRPILEGVFAVLEQAQILGSLLKPEEQLDAAIQAFRQQRRGGQAGLLAEDDAANRLLAELARHDPDELKKLLLERIAASFAREARESDVSGQLLGREAGEGLHLLQLLDRKYAVVATNPPYMGSSNMSAPLKKYVEEYYKVGKRDLYAAFILRCLDLAKHDGRLAMITQQTWMFLSSFADLRSAMHSAPSSGSQDCKQFPGVMRVMTLDAIAHLGRYAFSEIGNAAVAPLMFVGTTTPPKSTHLIWSARLKAPRPSREQDQLLRASVRNRVGSGITNLSSQSDLLLVPGSPVLYSASKEIVDALAHNRRIGDVAIIIEGLGTRWDDRYLRFNPEMPTNEAVANSRWHPFVKGGGYSRWDGLKLFQVDWQDDGARITNFRDKDGRLQSRPQNIHGYFSDGLTYSAMAQGSLSIRSVDSDTIPGDAGPLILSAIPSSVLVSLLNSRYISFVLRIISPTLQLKPGYVALAPLPEQIDEHLLEELSKLCMGLKGELIGSNILERKFDVEYHSSGSPSESDLATVWLLTCEGLLERYVLESYTSDASTRQQITRETGTPAGWYPLLSEYASLPAAPQRVALSPKVLEDLHIRNRLTPTWEELGSIKLNLRLLYEAGPGAKVDDLDLEDLDHQNDEEEGESGAYIPIPTETFLEELSVKLQIHPISAYWLLEELLAEGVRCKPEEQRLLEDRLTVLLLRLLGHRWPKQIEAGEPVPPWADQDGVIPLTAGTGESTLAGRMRERLRAEDGDLGAQETEALLQELTNRTLEEWLRKDFFKRHTSQFKKRPIAWHLASDPTSAGRKRSAEPAFECMVYFHATGSNAPLLGRGAQNDILARIRTQYVDRLLAPAQRDLAQARRDGDETAAAQATALIQELDDFAQRLRKVEEDAFACKDLDKYVDDEPLDRWAGDGVFPPGSRAELLAQEQAWTVDINDGVRVNVAPIQQAGLLVSDVLAKKDVSKAIADRARWRSDERRWVREGKLPRCGWMDESVPESPKWTELAPEREKERLRLEEKRAKVLAELEGSSD